jgi:hypothetical protein
MGADGAGLKCEDMVPRNERRGYTFADLELEAGFICRQLRTLLEQVGWLLIGWLVGWLAGECGGKAMYLQG